MTDQNETAEAATAEPSELQIINGGIEITVTKIDASSEKVKVRQLPISLIGQWGQNQGSEFEAYLVELLCDKIDSATVYHLQNARMIDIRVLQILQQAPFDQIDAIEKRLRAVREEIAKHEATTRWSDTLTHESVAQIREVGEQLNKKKYARQIERATKSSTAILETLPKSADQNSFSPSPPSDKSPSVT